MPLVLACVDGSVYAASVADHAGWAARRSGAGVEVLQVLGRRETRTTDRAVRLSPGPKATLAEEIAALDAERARLLRKQAHLGLEEARFRVEAAGIVDVQTLLRDGDLLEAVADREAGADMIVIGKRGEAADFARLHLGSNLERIVRACRRPILIAARGFRPVARVLVAFDGREGAAKAVEAVARDPLFAELSIEVLSVGAPSDAARWRLDAAVASLRAAGRAAEGRLVAGEPEHAIAAAVEAGRIDLLVMGAYSHSRLRSMVIGSTTSAVIRACRSSVLLFR